MIFLLFFKKSLRRPEKSGHKVNEKTVPNHISPKILKILGFTKKIFKII